MLVNLRNLRRMRVDDVSVPRADIVAISEPRPSTRWWRRSRPSTVSRLPVYGETLDQPLGLVHLKDLALIYGFGAPAADFDLSGLLRPLLYAPPSMPIGVLLQKMQAARIHMALVIDEYGGVDGLVTIEDLLEQIVGDIADEHDEVEGALWTEEAPGVYLAQARMDLDAFEAAAGVRLADRELAEEVDTLGGLVIRLAGPGAGARRGGAAPRGPRVRGGRRRRAPDQAAAGAAARPARGRGGGGIGRAASVPAIAAAGRRARAAGGGWRWPSAAGAALALAQPPVSLAGGAVPGAAGAAVAARRHARRRAAAFAVGWLAGAGHFAAALFWIVEPFLVEPEVHRLDGAVRAGRDGRRAGAVLGGALRAGAGRWPPGSARVLVLAALWTLADYAAVAPADRLSLGARRPTPGSRRR